MPKYVMRVAYMLIWLQKMPYMAPKELNRTQSTQENRKKKVK